MAILLSCASPAIYVHHHHSFPLQGYVQCENCRGTGFRAKWMGAGHCGPITMQ